MVELDRLALQRPTLVEAREQQEILDEQAHPLGLTADSPHRAREILRAAFGAAREELRVGAHRGERRAQLVRGVGDEAAQAPVGGFDLAEHVVERDAEAADLGALVGDVHAAREVARGDRARGGGDRVERAQSEADHPEGERHEGREDGHGDEELDQD